MLVCCFVGYDRFLPPFVRQILVGSLLDDAGNLMLTYLWVPNESIVIVTQKNKDFDSSELDPNNLPQVSIDPLKID